MKGGGLAWIVAYSRVSCRYVSIRLQEGLRLCCEPACWLLGLPLLGDGLLFASKNGHPM